MRITVHITSVDWDTDNEEREDLPHTASIGFDDDVPQEVQNWIERAVDILSDDHGWAIQSCKAQFLEIELD